MSYQGYTEAETQINDLWEQLVLWINRAAKKSIPFKTVKNSLDEKQKLVTWNPRYKWLKVIRKLCKRAKENLNKEINIIEWVELIATITKINRHNDTCIPNVEQYWTQEWLDQAQSWSKIIENKMVSEQRRDKEKKIRGYVKRRFGMVGSEEKRILSSILEKPWQKLKIEKVLISDRKEDDGTQLVYELDDVKRTVTTYYDEQYNRVKGTTNRIPQKWQQEYSPKEWIKEEWYGLVLKEITLLEWEEAMHKTADDSAPGISGIGYAFLRRIGPKTKAYILKLLNKILKEGIYPRKWKVGMIFPYQKLLNGT